MRKRWIDLQFFAEGEAAGAEAAAAPAGGAEATPAAETAPVTAGDTLKDGTQVQNAQIAAALNRQMRRHPEMRQVYAQNRQAQPQQQAEPEAEETNDQKWERLKKGEFAEQYGRDVQAAIQDRFKNQKDANQQLTSLQPMLDALMKKNGVNTLEELSQRVLDDDSLYEEEADRMGMTVDAYKTFKRLQDEHDAREAMDRQSIQQQQFRQHLSGLAEQAEELKKTFPDFDLMKELQNERFRQLTRPGSGLSLEEAFYALHRRELEPQIMAYGMDRARQQMGATLQAQRQRPAEGAAMARGGSASEIKVNPKALSRPERQRIAERVRRGEKITFD